MIPQEAVEALARHNFEESYRHLGWDELTDDVRAGWLKQAQAQCEAAGPFLRAQALEDAADALVWVRPDKSPCETVEACCGSEASCDAMYPSTSVVGETWLRARAATERGAA